MILYEVMKTHYFGWYTKCEKNNSEPKNRKLHQSRAKSKASKLFSMGVWYMIGTGCTKATYIYFEAQSVFGNIIAYVLSND